MTPLKPDFSDPSSVVQAFIHQMHCWEAVAGSLSASAMARYRPDDGSTMHPEELRLRKLIWQISLSIAPNLSDEAKAGVHPFGFVLDPARNTAPTKHGYASSPEDKIPGDRGNRPQIQLLRRHPRIRGQETRGRLADRHRRARYTRYQESEAHSRMTRTAETVTARRNMAVSLRRFVELRVGLRLPLATISNLT